MFLIYLNYGSELWITVKNRKVKVIFLLYGLWPFFSSSFYSVFMRPIKVILRFFFLNWTFSVNLKLLLMQNICKDVWKLSLKLTCIPLYHSQTTNSKDVYCSLWTATLSQNQVSSSDTFNHKTSLIAHWGSVLTVSL